jgi:hypothetical protein
MKYVIRGAVYKNKTCSLYSKDCVTWHPDPECEQKLVEPLPLSTPVSFYIFAIVVIVFVGIIIYHSIHS